MQDRISEILEEAKQRLQNAAETKQVEDVRINILGKKGQLTEILRGMGKLSKEEKKQIGPAANKAKNEIEQMINRKFEEVKEAAKLARFEMEKIDVTEPGKDHLMGVRHPITLVAGEIKMIFKNLGYEIVSGPLVDSVFNAFDGLNSPQNHPSRDMTDTFYITEDECLRPHTSTVQVRTIMDRKPPFRIISPGRCFRVDTPDATHSPMFHQIEGLIVDEGITMTDLKGTLDYMAKQLFGPETKTKFRPHHFPFTEPSAEMDVSCFKCGGKGCSVCKGSGWIEILGCGVTHPKVLEVGGIDTEKYTAFAFGMGVERIAMLKYGIDDIRLFYENDMRFIDQFK